MRTRRAVIVTTVLIAAAIGWYLFRPERLFIDQAVSEALPTAAAGLATSAPDAGPQALLAGRFRSVAHETTGLASVYRLADGKRVLRLTEFATSNGPDVQVYLVAAADAPDHDTVTRAGFVNVGALKGNIGDQNYQLPDDLDLGKYRAVTVWCRRFGVNFGTAPLGPAEPGTRA
jgi:hypothetical protein